MSLPTPTTLPQLADSIDDIFANTSATEVEFSDDVGEVFTLYNDAAKERIDSFDDTRFTDVANLTSAEQSEASDILELIEDCANNDDFGPFFDAFRNAMSDADPSEYELADPPPVAGPPECFSFSTPFGYYCFPSYVCVMKFAELNGFRGVILGDCREIPGGCQCYPISISMVWVLAFFAVVGLWWSWPALTVGALDFLAALRARALTLGIG